MPLETAQPLYLDTCSSQNYIHSSTALTIYIFIVDGCNSKTYGITAASKIAG